MLARLSGILCLVRAPQLKKQPQKPEFSGIVLKIAEPSNTLTTAVSGVSWAGDFWGVTCGPGFSIRIHCPFSCDVCFCKIFYPRESYTIMQSCNFTGGMWIHKKLMCIFNVKIFRIFSDQQRETWAVHLLTLWHASPSGRMNHRGFEFSNLSASLRLKKYAVCYWVFIHFALMLLFGKYKAFPVVCGVRWLASYGPSLRNTRSNGEGGVFSHVTDAGPGGAWHMCGVLDLPAAGPVLPTNSRPHRATEHLKCG